MALFRLEFGNAFTAKSALSLFGAVAEYATRKSGGRHKNFQPCGGDVHIWRYGQWRLFLSWWFTGDYEALDAFVAGAWVKNKWMLPPEEGGTR